MAENQSPQCYHTRKNEVFENSLAPVTKRCSATISKKTNRTFMILHTIHVKDNGFSKKKNSCVQEVTDPLNITILGKALHLWVVNSHRLSFSFDPVFKFSSNEKSESETEFAQF